MKTGKIVAGLAIVVLSLVVMGSMASAMSQNHVDVNVGTGAKYTAVAYGNGTFMVVWYNATGAYLNATVINSTTGNVIKTGTIATDIYTYNGKPSIAPKVAYIGGNNTYLISWVTSNKYLKAIGVNTELQVTIPETIINDTSGVSYKGFAMAVGDNKAFFVWSNSTYQLRGRFINDTFTGNSFNITNTKAVYQQNPWISYDPTTNNFMVTWINVTENSTGSKFYNITGKIYNGDTMDNVSETIIIANAFATDSSYTSPTVCGGDGYFFETFVNYSTPYNITGRIYYASNGTPKSPAFLIGNSYYYGRSPMPAIYNGSAFIVVWSNSTESILARGYDNNGSPQATYTIYNGTNGGNPNIAYDQEDDSYYVVWTEYTGGSYTIDSAVYSSDITVPELNLFIPVLAVVAVGLYAMNRKH